MKIKQKTNIAENHVTFDEVRSWFEEHMHPSKIDFNDQKPYEVYANARWAGIFQCTGPGAQRLFVKAKPKSILDIAALTSIYRPGPLASKVDKLWLDHENEHYDWGHELINETLSETRGLLIFQESVMALAHKVSGFPLAETDEVRRAIMKRSISGGEAAKAKAKELEDSIVDGAVKNGVPRETAKQMYETILRMSGYGFNKSHAVAYAIDSFWCAWLLTYYEEEWICAYLESMSKTPENRAKAFGEIRSLGYQIVPIDVNYAGYGWTVLPGKRLMPSMTSVKGVGEAALEEIIQFRPFRSFEDMLYNDDGTWKLSKFNKKALESLIKIRALDSLDAVGSGKLFNSYKHMYETLFSYYDEPARGQRGEDGEMVQREHFSLIKRSTKADAAEGRKNLYELARVLGESIKDEWTMYELAQHQAELFGTVDVTSMIEPSVMKKLASNDISSIEEMEHGESKIVWFITVPVAQKRGDPVTGLVKQAKSSGKTYVVSYVSGPSGKPLKISMWGMKETLDAYMLCIGEVKRDDFGYSTAGWKLKFV